MADISACVDEVLLQRALNDRASRSKRAMEGGEAILSIDDEDDGIFELFATHSESARGVTAEHLSKVWKISEEDAFRTLKQTTQLDKQDADASLARRFGTNNRMLR